MQKGDNGEKGKADFVGYFNSLFACNSHGVTAHAKPKASQSSKPAKKGYRQLGQKKAKELTKKLEKIDKFLESLVPKEYWGSK